MDGLISLVIVVIITIGVVMRGVGKNKAAEEESKKRQSYYADNTASPVASNVSKVLETVKSTQPPTATVSKPASSPVTVPRPQAQPAYYQKKPSDSGIDHKMSRETGNVLRDDRSGDWLAKQLADERKAYRQVSEMFELKAYHANQCEAEMLKRFHTDNCDAEGIDTAKGR